MHWKLLCLRSALGLLFATCLMGCAASPGSQALADAFRHLRADTAANSDIRRLDPRFKYLRVQIDRRVAFLALGYIDSYQGDPVEVWYSADGDVLRLRDGHLAGATMNTGIEWLSVSFVDLPKWHQVGSSASFERSRDVSPGYRYGIREKMLIRRIEPPADSHLQLVPLSSLTWFDETAGPGANLPPARYGVSMSGAASQVVYAEQCLSSDFCFSWQRWNPLKESRR